MITDVSKEYEKIEQDKAGIIIKLMTGSFGYEPNLSSNFTDNSWLISTKTYGSAKNGIFL